MPSWWTLGWCFYNCGTIMHVQDLYRWHLNGQLCYSIHYPPQHWLNLSLRQVLPPWTRLYHWQSRELGDQSRIPWSLFFDLSSLRRFIPVIDYEQFAGQGEPQVMLQWLRQLGNEQRTFWFIFFWCDVVHFAHLFMCSLSIFYFARLTFKSQNLWVRGTF